MAPAFLTNTLAQPARRWDWTPPRLAWTLLGGGLLLSLLLPAPSWRHPAAGLVAAGLGLAMATGAKARYRSEGTAVCPSRAPTVLVTGGWFRLSRNPMDLGLALVLLGAGLLTGAWPGLIAPLVFLALIRRAFVPVEEDACQAAFGEAWEAYRRRVPRWL